MSHNRFKRILKIILSSFFTVFTFVFLFFYMPALYGKYSSKAHDLIKIANENIQKKNFKDDDLAGIFPNNFLFVFWINDLNNKWIPLIIDKKDMKKIKIEISDIEPKVPKTISFLVYEVNSVKFSEGYQYKIWLKRFNYNYFLKDILIILIFILTIYLLFILIIEVFFNCKPVDITDEFKISTDKQEIDKTGTEEKMNIYREFWKKNYNISTNFKNDFPFKKINDLIILGKKPDEYIREVLQISSDYFKWKNPKIFIYQDDKIINTLTKDILDESNLNIPLNGSVKNDIFIPLFPYSKDKIFGYLYFYWDNTVDFYLSDVLYFLKFFLSERAKLIFLFYNQYQDIINQLSVKIESLSDVFICIFEIDNISKIKSMLNSSQLTENLNHNIGIRISNFFNNCSFYQICAFNYLIIGVNIQKDIQIKAVNDFILNPDNQNFSASSEYGNIAVTYSCGASFKNSRNIHPASLISEAETNLVNVQKTGGNSFAF